jgi:hypothetical protein
MIVIPAASPRVCTSRCSSRSRPARRSSTTAHPQSRPRTRSTRCSRRCCGGCGCSSPARSRTRRSRRSDRVVLRHLGRDVRLLYVTPGPDVETPSVAYTFQSEPLTTRQARDDKKRLDWFASGSHDRREGRCTVRRLHRHGLPDLVRWRLTFRLTCVRSALRRSTRSSSDARARLDPPVRRRDQRLRHRLDRRHRQDARRLNNKTAWSSTDRPPRPARGRDRPACDATRRRRSSPARPDPSSRASGATTSPGRASSRSRCPTTYDWLLWLDDDDVDRRRASTCGSSPRPPPRRRRVRLQYDYARDEHGNCVCELWRERLMRRAAGYTWKGAVHEVLVPPDGHPPRLVMVPPSRCATSTTGPRTGTTPTGT